MWNSVPVSDNAYMYMLHDPRSGCVSVELIAQQGSLLLLSTRGSDPVKLRNCPLVAQRDSVLANWRPVVQTCSLVIGTEHIIEHFILGKLFH